VIGDNIYHIKTGISDLKDEDFTQAAQEYQQKHPELASRQAKLAERERERERAFESNRLFT